MKHTPRAWLVLGMAALVSACATPSPTTATLTGATGGDGVASADGFRGPLGRVEPADCPGAFGLLPVTAGEGWVKMEAAWFDAKGQKYLCGSPVFTITPEAELSNPRFNPYQVVISGQQGHYVLTATVGNQAAVSVKVYIK